MAFAVDHRHIVRPVPSMDSPMPFLPIEFCVVKRTGVALYSLRESLKYLKVGRSAFPFRLLTYCSTAGNTTTGRSVPRPSYWVVSMHRRSRVLLSRLSRCRHSDAASPHLPNTNRTRHTTTSTDDPSRWRRGISYPFLDWCGHDGGIHQSQR